MLINVNSASAVPNEEAPSRSWNCGGYAGYPDFDVAGSASLGKGNDIGSIGQEFLRPSQFGLAKQGRSRCQNNSCRSPKLMCQNHFLDERTQSLD